MRSFRKSWIGIVLVFLFSMSLFLWRQGGSVSNIFNSDNIIAKVGSAQITTTTFNRVLQMNINQFNQILGKELSGEEYHALKDAIHILVKKQEKLSNKDKQQLKKLFSYSPTLKAAYRFAQQLTAIFNANHRKSAAEKKLTKEIIIRLIVFA